jgi:hypothetical protein
MDLPPLEDADALASVDLGPDPEPACRIPWAAEGRTAIELFVEERLLDRAEEMCARIEDIAARHTDLDSLVLEVATGASGMGIRIVVLDPPPEGVAPETVPLGATVG